MVEQNVNEELAELVGIMFGDGCLSVAAKKHLIYISGHKVDDLQYHTITTKSLFKNVFNKEVFISFRKDENALFIRFSDKLIFDRFTSLGLPVGRKYGALKLPAFCEETQLFFAFLRGLFDTDGCVVLSKQHRQDPYYPRLEITSKSESFMKEILTKLRKLDFYGSVSDKGGSYRLELPGHINLDLWVKQIGFHNPKHGNKAEKIKSKTL